MTAYSGAVTKLVGVKKYTAVIRESDVQQAWCSSVEKYYDKFIWQCVTYCQALSGKLEPTWTAVTGYYAAFFGATLTLAMTGELRRTLATTPAINAGLWVVTSKPEPGAAGQVRVRFEPPGKGTHQQTWRSFDNFMRNLSTSNGIDAETRKSLETVARFSKHPEWLSDFRNQINYRIDALGWSSEWPSTFRDVGSLDELEHLLVASKNVRGEVRLEMVILLCALLVRSLYDDHLRASPKMDTRPHERRRKMLKEAEQLELAAINCL